MALKKKILGFYLLRVHVLLTCMSVHHMRAWYLKSKEPKLVSHLVSAGSLTQSSVGRTGTLSCPAVSLAPSQMPRNTNLGLTLLWAPAPNPSKTTVVYLWVETPLGNRTTLSQGLNIAILHIRYLPMIHNSSKISVTK